MEENKRYVLCEFINEDLQDNDETDRPVQVAHADWLVLDEPNVLINTLIREEREVVIKWPKNYNVQPQEVMAKIQSDVIKWINTVAILRAQSNEWAEIVEASKNIVKYGVPFPTKQQRKELVKKKDIDVNSNTKKLPKSLVENRNLTLGKKVNKKLMANARDKFKLKNYDTLDKSPLSKTKSAAMKIKQQKQKENTKHKYFDSFSDDSEESEIERHNKLSKKELLSKNSILEADNRKLRNDLKLYKTMRIITEEFPLLKSKIKNLSSRCKCCKHAKKEDGSCMKDSEVTEKCQKTTKIKSEGISSFIALQGDQSNVVNEATKVDHYSLQEKIEIDDKWDSNCYMKETSKMKEFKQDLSCVSVSTISSPPLNHRQVLSPLMEKDSLNVVPSTSILPNKNSTNCVIQDQKSYLHRTYKENDPTKEMISFGSKNVSLATVQKVRHSKVSVLASELCNLVFSNRELALCSLKGKKTNAHKNSFQKQAIDEAKIKGIIEYIAKYFCKSPDNIKDEVYKAIGNKLNNFSKTFEGKKIINDYLAEKFAQQQQQVEANQQQQQQVEANQQQQQQVEANQQQQQQVEANQQQQQQDEANQQQQTDNVSFLRQIATLQQLATPQQQEALQQLINLANNNN